MVLNEQLEHFSSRENLLIFFELLDFSSSQLSPWHKIAWAFLSLQGHIGQRCRLQLYQFPKKSHYPPDVIEVGRKEREREGGKGNAQCVTTPLCLAGVCAVVPPTAQALPQHPACDLAGECSRLCPPTPPHPLHGTHTTSKHNELCTESSSLLTPSLHLTAGGG